MSVPELPESFGVSMSDSDLAELWHELVIELMNPKFANRLHNNRRTYDAGCSGPLCLKAVREHSRRRSLAEPSERSRQKDLALGFWEPIALERIAAAHAAALKALSPLEAS